MLVRRTLKTAVLLVVWALFLPLWEDGLELILEFNQEVHLTYWEEVLGFLSFFALLGWLVGLFALGLQSYLWVANTKDMAQSDVDNQQKS